MAHFAQTNEFNLVTQVIVINNEEVPDEATGIVFCKSLFGEDTEWIQTSYNANFRKQFAGIGYSYNADLDMFLIPKCHNEAVLNELGDWDCDNADHEEVKLIAGTPLTAAEADTLVI